jgi:hypothetical protein
MLAAENLYTSGYISYPRTETAAYPFTFDLHSALKEQAKYPSWGRLVGFLLFSGKIDGGGWVGEDRCNDGGGRGCVMVGVGVVEEVEVVNTEGEILMGEVAEVVEEESENMKTKEMVEASAKAVIMI